MITKETNERLTQTGPGTPMGNLLRRYWHVVGALPDLEADPVRPVRLLGEDLILFRDEAGRLGLIAERCAHRGISLAHGIPQSNGLRCAYHGWTYDPDGHVVDMPFEPACLPLRIAAYPVAELGGLVWAYLGPEPRPLLPRYEGFVREDLDKNVTIKLLPCNWVQCMDNSMDPVHFEHLHGHYGNYMNRRLGKEPAMRTPRHLKIAFEEFEYGVYKRRLVEGETEDCDDWTVGHPILFPNILAQLQDAYHSYQIRVPVDDTHTLHVLYRGTLRKPGAAPQNGLIVKHERVEYDDLGRVFAPTVIQQDEAAWIGQGPISDRTVEHLVTSDKGVALYHNLLLENIEKVERGEDPMAVVRDPAKNEPMIEIRHERVARAAYRPWLREGFVTAAS
ncbi:MAG TPA: Rieske 2Fe-2S domain-containing protein [Chloroflexota bacterium]|nr:Rieske 2Fe-2S domain-containing protein [Chloroflexota bacterium]